MINRITRRAAARLVLAGSAALALPKAQVAAAPLKRKKAVPASLSPAEHRKVQKAVAQLQSTAEKLRKVAVPMGSEPGFVFRPILPSK